MTLDDKEWEEFQTWCASKWILRPERFQIEVFLEWREKFKKQEAKSEATQR